MKVETLNHCHDFAEKGYLFHSEDTQSTEDEYLHLLHAVVYCLKPLNILETGSFKGYGTCTMAKALERTAQRDIPSELRHIGHIWAIEKEPKAAEWTRAMLRQNGLAGWATVFENDSIEFLSTATLNFAFDFAFFDSLLSLRCKELALCLDRGLLKPGAFFAIHDTSRLRILTPGEKDPLTSDFWRDFESEKRVKFVEFPLSRGLVLGQVL